MAPQRIEHALAMGGSRAPMVPASPTPLIPSDCSGWRDGVAEEVIGDVGGARQWVIHELAGPGNWPVLVIDTAFEQALAERMRDAACTWPSTSNGLSWGTAIVHGDVLHDL